MDRNILYWSSAFLFFLFINIRILFFDKVNASLPSPPKLLDVSVLFNESRFCDETDFFTHFLKRYKIRFLMESYLYSALKLVLQF